MKKEIYFCVDYESWKSWHKIYRMCSYKDTEESIKNGESKIVTMSLAHLSFDLITLGYDIYLCYKDKKIKIEEGMKLGNGAILYIEGPYDLLDTFLAGNFDKLLEI